MGKLRRGAGSQVADSACSEQVHGGAQGVGGVCVCVKVSGRVPLPPPPHTVEILGGQREGCQRGSEQLPLVLGVRLVFASLCLDVLLPSGVTHSQGKRW